MSEKKSGIRLNRLTIKNYKKIDYLEIDFPLPVMQGDADILVLGSKNGGGKTSVLECCALLILGGIIEQFENFTKYESLLFDVANLLIKAGEKQANIDGEFICDDKICFISLVINTKKGFINPKFKGDKSIFKYINNDKKRYFGDIDDYLTNILAFVSEPLIIPPLLHFNSYRKIQEFKPELGMMTEDYPSYRTSRPIRLIEKQNLRNSVSSFKIDIIRSLMANNDLFEGINKSQSKSDLKLLNELIKKYCSGQIAAHLRPLIDNKLDIRIKPINGKESFSFDGLSSGQKEIIATLFLIWKNTKDQPSIVLIDEPELHLNAEWHGDFIRQLHKLAPHNQYIIATHSEEIFNSVDENYRAVLIPNEE